MVDPITIVVDQEPIKFTPDGKIAILDAIGSLCINKDIPALWHDLLTLNPDLAEVCEDYLFSRKHKTLVTNGDGWEKIQTALFEHLINSEML